MGEECELGSRICKRLKRIYFDDQSWAKSHKLISIKFSYLKSKMNGFYAGMNRVEMLKELVKYSDDDLRDCFT